MLNVVLIGFYDSVSPVIDRLVRENIINIKKSYYFPTPKVDDLRAIIKNIRDLDMDYAYRIPYSLYSKCYSKYFGGFCANISRMHTRLGFSQTSCHEALQLFNVLYQYVYDILVKNEVDFILHGSMPHEVVDYVYYTLAQELDIKFVFCDYLPYSKINLFWLRNKIEEIGTYKHLPAINSFDEIDPEKALKIYSSPKTLKGKKESLDVLLYKFLDSDNLYYDINKKQYKEYKRINEHIQKEILPEGIDYVYYPMHYQPEASIIAQAPVYLDDQAVAIEQIARKLPKNCYVVVKEHFVQVFNYREPVMYHRLAALNNVIFASEKLLSTDLIAKAKATVTITGTAGFESLLAGKPVIYFGYPSLFREMTGAFPFSDDLDINEVFNFKIDKELIKQEYNRMINTAYHGITIPNIYFPLDCSEEENVERLYEIYKNYISKNITEEYKENLAKMYKELRQTTYTERFEPNEQTADYVLDKEYFKEKLYEKNDKIEKYPDNPISKIYKVHRKFDEVEVTLFGKTKKYTDEL